MSGPGPAGEWPGSRPAVAAARDPWLPSPDSVERARSASSRAARLGALATAAAALAATALGVGVVGGAVPRPAWFSRLVAAPAGPCQEYREASQRAVDVLAATVAGGPARDENLVLTGGCDSSDVRGEPGAWTSVDLSRAGEVIGRLPRLGCPLTAERVLSSAGDLGCDLAAGSFRGHLTVTVSRSRIGGQDLILLRLVNA